MALGSALVDRARIWRRERTEQVVDGERQLTAKQKFPATRWFRVRLEVTPTSERQEDGRRAETRRHSILVGRKWGGQIRATDEIEVESAQLGSRTYQVTGQPEPLRRRRTVIGYVVQLVEAE